MTAHIKYRESGASAPLSTTVKGSPLTNSEIDGNFKSVVDEIAAVQTSAGTTQSNLGTLEQTVGTVQSNLSSLTTTVGGHTTQIGNIVQNVSANTQDISNLQSSLSSLNSNAVTLNGIQTVTNKTLTSPVINAPTINGFTGNTDGINIGAGQFVKDTAGNIGLGIAVPTQKLDINGTNPGIRIKDGSNTSGLVISQAASGVGYLNMVDNKDLVLSTNNVERVRVKTSGIDVTGDVVASSKVSTADVVASSKVSTADVVAQNKVAIGKTTANANLDFRETTQIIATNTTAVQSNTYVITANCTLTLPITPVAGDWVKVVNGTTSVAIVVARNGQNIMGLAEDITLNLANVGMTFTYANAGRGWVIS